METTALIAKHPWLAEFIGTAFLILLGNGVVANCLLEKSKGQGSGWIVITAGWGMAVAMAVYAVGAYSGAHLNPAVTLGLASIGAFAGSKVPFYVAAQLAGAFFGAVLVWILYLPHWAPTEDGDLKQACFCTAPAIYSPVNNFLSEAIGTGALLFGVLALGDARGAAPAMDPLLVGLLVFSIGLSLGGTTGYAINPARDLGPRLAHQLLPIPGKVDSGWGYSWIPVVGPLVGGVVGSQLFQFLYR